MTEPRALCRRCERPRSVCVCASIVRVPTRTQIVILQHPRERRVPIGTARLAELVFPNAVRHVGIDFTEHPVRELLASSGAPVLLYPGAEPSAAPAPSVRPQTLVVLDGTWWQAEKLFKTNAFLAELPRIALAPSEPSRYRIRREPAAHCVSTIEAIVQALELLEGDASVARALAPFDAMVETQLAFAGRGQSRHVRKARTPRVHPLARLLATRRADIVVAYGEANAWPKRSPLGHAPEIVHWAALRPFGGERFEALIAPRQRPS